MDISSRARCHISDGHNKLMKWPDIMKIKLQDVQADSKTLSKFKFFSQTGYRDNKNRFDYNVKKKY